MAPLSGANMVYAPVPPFESSVSASPVEFSASTRRENDGSAFKVCQIVPAVFCAGLLIGISGKGVVLDAGERGANDPAQKAQHQHRDSSKYACGALIRHSRRVLSGTAVRVHGKQRV